MIDALQDPTVRGAAIIVAALLLTQLVKELSERFADNKLVLRATVLSACGGGALVAAWGPDGQVAFAEWWAYFWPAVTTAEFSYQWVLKALANWHSGRTKPLAVGMAAVGVAILLIISAPASHAFDWNELVPDEGGVCLLTSEGLGRGALTGSWSLVNEPGLQIDADALLTSGGDAGVGASLCLGGVGWWLRVPEWFPQGQALLDRSWFGAFLWASGALEPGGLYWKFTVAERRF